MRGPDGKRSLPVGGLRAHDLNPEGWARGWGPYQSFPGSPPPAQTSAADTKPRAGREGAAHRAPRPWGGGRGMGAGEATPPPRSRLARLLRDPCPEKGEEAAEDEEEGRGGQLPPPFSASCSLSTSMASRSPSLPPPPSAGLSGTGTPPPTPPTPSPSLVHTPARRRPGGAPKGAGGSERESETERASTSPSRYHQPSNMAPGTSPRARSPPPSSRPPRAPTRSPRARARRRRAPWAAPETRQGPAAPPSLGWWTPGLPALYSRRIGRGPGLQALVLSLWVFASCVMLSNLLSLSEPFFPGPCNEGTGIDHPEQLLGELSVYTQPSVYAFKKNTQCYE